MTDLLTPERVTERVTEREPVREPVREPAKRWRNKWRTGDSPARDATNGFVAHPNTVVWASRVHPSKELAEAFAAQKIRSHHFWPAEMRPTYLGAFPVDAP